MMNLNQSHLMILIVIFSTNLFMNIQSDRGFIHFEILYWQNPHNWNYKGKDWYPKESIPRCGTMFVICISDRAIPEAIDKKNCPIHFKAISPYKKGEFICMFDFNNRSHLENWTDLKASINLLAVPEKYFIKIQAYHYSNNFNEWDLIATFSNEFSQMPSQNLSSFNMEEISMNRCERNFSNTNASLKISMGIQCERYLYGKNCMTECQDFQSDHFVCSKDGRKICKEGWKGPNCQITNSCEKLKCARGTTCNISDNEAKCMCNGRIDPECNQNYNPCSPNPCLNNGECVSHENNGQQCECVRGYFGDLCEKTVEHWMIIGSIIGLIVILIVITISFGCIYLTRRPKNLQNKEIHMDHMSEDMDDNQYTIIPDNRNRSEYGQRFYADGIQLSKKV